MTKYTKSKIEKALTKLETVKKKQEEVGKLTRQLETVYRRIYNAMYDRMEFKQKLKDRLEEIKTELVNTGRYLYENKSFTTRMAKTLHQRELQSVYGSFNGNYEQTVSLVQEIQAKDRKHYIKKGEIKE